MPAFFSWIAMPMPPNPAPTMTISGVAVTDGTAVIAVPPSPSSGR